MNRLPRTVHIHYLRPPDHRTIYRQDLIHEDAHVKVTLARKVSLPRPVKVAGDVVLEDGADAIWFTFPGRWYDVGRFHRADGSFTGIYANLITPCVFEPGDDWETTDLFLDVWLGHADTEPTLLDEDELAEAERRQWLSGTLADRARSEARSLEERVRQGQWPPRVVEEWPLERARAAVAYSSST